MQTRMSKARPGSRARAVPGKQTKGAARTDQPGKTARRILVSALLLGSLAVGSAAASQYATATGHVSAHHQTAVGPINNSPWMY